MSRKLEIYTDLTDNPRKRIGSAYLSNGKCIIDKFGKHVKIHDYTSEYAMIQQIVRDYSNGYVVVDKGGLA